MTGVRDYAVVTAAYWAFTLTDGALRMLVLLYLHEIGYAPLAIASLFVFYEFFGVVTNLLGGWLGARFGLESTLLSGLGLQVLALAMLAARGEHLTVSIVMLAQALSGIAKDLTKMSAKSYVKRVVAAGDRRGLLRWVAWITGGKNTLKGVGFFLGGLLLGWVGFRCGCLGMAGFVGLALVLALLLLPRTAGRLRAKVALRSLVPPPGPIRWLSASRLCLFAARDVWFVLALPIYLGTVLDWDHHEVGAFLALWVVGYGAVQALAPAFVGARSSAGARSAPDGRRLGHWTAALVIPLGAVLAALPLGLDPAAALIAGLALFGFLFAANSAIHSYLIVAYAESDKVALRVGFYYMANAWGRLTGTVLSGAVFQAAGLGQKGLIACLATALLFVLASALLCAPLAASERRASAPPAARPPQEGAGT